MSLHEIIGRYTKQTQAYSFSANMERKEKHDSRANIHSPVDKSVRRNLGIRNSLEYAQSNELVVYVIKLLFDHSLAGKFALGNLVMLTILQEGPGIHRSTSEAPRIGCHMDSIQESKTLTPKF